MKITIIQSEILWEDKITNLNHLSDLIGGIKDQTDIIILPETFNTGFSMNPGDLAEEPGSYTYIWMQDIARKMKASVCGSYFVQEAGHFFNRFIFVDSTGRSISYNKRHLFSIGGEDTLFTRGSERNVFKYGDFRINPSICYDLRFPVWLRNRRDYDLLLCVANWPESRRDVWNTLLRARAIENQSYVAGVNCVGIDNAGNRCVGESAIIDPRGREIVTLPLNREGVATASVSIQELEDFRKKFPVWEDADDFTINN